jgi:type II secretory pathway predicted ATPase ExeA
VDERVPKPPLDDKKDVKARPLSPTASAALAAASAALAALNVPAKPPVKSDTGAAPSGPRKLIDLFPPARPAAATAPASPKKPAAADTSAPADAAPPPRTAAAYERFYGLAERPFDLSTDPRFLFHWDSHDRVLRDVTAAIARHDGTILLIGDAGAGKTTLCRAIIARLGRRTLVSFVGETAAAARDVLKTVLVDFGVISRADAVSGRLREASLEDLATTLRNFLASLAALQAVALIVIDDAQKLSPEVLSDLQVLSELAAEHALLQIVLVGEPDLTTRLRSDQLQTWSRRIGMCAELGPLEGGDVADYVAHRLAVAGTTDALFDEHALSRLHQLSRGSPRVVNLVSEHALVIGEQASARSIDDRLVDRAARDLGLLPEAPAVSWPVRMLLLVSMVALMLAGAASAAWLLRDPLLRVLARYGVSLSR